MIHGLTALPASTTKNQTKAPKNKVNTAMIEAPF